MLGNRYKLPNVYAHYRCIQTNCNNKLIIVNTTISPLNENEINKLKDLEKIYNLTLIKRGYYYDKFFISVDDKFFIFNRYIELENTNILDNEINKYITYINEKKDFICPIQGKSTYTSVIIKIEDIEIELQRIYHPQIINGINITDKRGKVQNITGIFNTNHNPKYFKIKKLTNTKLLNTLDKNIGIYQVNKKEIWVKNKNNKIEKRIVNINK